MPQRLSRRTFVLAASATTATLASARSTGAQEASPVASPAPDPGILPDTPAGRQLAWMLAVVNGELPVPGMSELRDRFAPSFLQAVPPFALIATIGQLRAQFAPIQLIQVVGIPTPLALNVLFSIPSGELVIASITVENDEPHLIDGLVFAPFDQEMPEVPALESWDELDAALVAAGAEEFSIHAARIGEDGEPAPVHEAHPELVLPLGSVFKLYVLGAVAEAIESGTLAWDDEVEVTEALLSLPTGVTQTEPIGAKLPVDDLARRMISISDNTATDLLIHAVGREAVEAALEPLGNSVPELNKPLLTTRELFVLKLGDEERRAAYIAADEAGRRAILDELATEPLPDITAALEWTTPIEVDTIAWLSTAPDMSSALVWLRDAWSRPGLEPIKEILTINPGMPFDEAAWDLVAFKGGSEPGVLAFAWLLERVDGTPFTITCALKSTTQLLDEEAAAIAMAGAFPLLAEA